MPENSGNSTFDYMYLWVIMRRLKTYTPSTMISERLNGIALMHVCQKIVPDIEMVIDLFTVTNRGLNFIWILLVFNQYIVFALRIIFANITCIYFSDISGLIYIIIIPILMEHVQIFKLSVKTYMLTYFLSFLIVGINQYQVMVKFQSSTSIQICSYYSL